MFHTKSLSLLYLYAQYDFFIVGTYCLSLSIHMEGKESGSLSILTQEGTEDAVLQTQYSGEQTVGWFRASTEIDLTPFTKVF